MNSNIEKVYYINLDKRTDRKEHMIGVVLPFLNVKENDVKRISAVDTTHSPTLSKRATGCTLSHLKALNDAIDNNYSHFMVLEDDFIPIISSSEFETRINRLFADFLDFDVCHLAYNAKHGTVKKINDIFMTGEGIQTMSGYIMNINFCNQIKPVWENSVKMLQNGGHHSKYALDMAWKPYQKFDRWLLTRCGKQLKGFSDLVGKNVNYGC